MDWAELYVWCLMLKLISYSKFRWWKHPNIQGIFSDCPAIRTLNFTAQKLSGNFQLYQIVANQGLNYVRKVRSKVSNWAPIDQNVCWLLRVSDLFHSSRYSVRLTGILKYFWQLLSRNIFAIKNILPCVWGIKSTRAEIMR